MSNVCSLNDIHTLTHYIRIITSKCGLGVQFKEGIPGPYTMKDQIVIPSFTAHMTNDDVVKIRGFVLHECLHHIKGPEVFDISEKYGFNAKHPLGSLFNLYEDSRIEMEGVKDYIGDKLILNQLRDLMWKDHLDYLGSQLKKCGNDEKNIDNKALRMLAAFNHTAHIQAHWLPSVAAHMRELVSSVEGLPTVTSKIDALMKAGLSERMLDARCAADAFQVSIDAYAILFDKTPDDVKKELEEMEKSAAERKASGKKGQSAKDGGDERSGTEKGEKKKAKVGRKGKAGESEEGDEKAELEGKIPFREMQHSYVEGSEGSGMGFDYTNFTGSQNFMPEPIEHMRVRNFITNKPDTRFTALAAHENRSKLHGSEYSNALSNKMRRYLMVRSAAYYVGNKKKGKVHKRAVWKVAAPECGSQEWMQRIFRTREQDDLLDTSVTVLTDYSGSMAGDKAVDACNSTLVLNNVISNTLHIPLEIIVFTWNGRSSDLGIIKPFTTRVNDDHIKSCFNVFATKMSGNADADAILYAQYRLLKQKSKKKVLIVLSDGSPADGYGTTNAEYALRRTVNDIQDAKRIDIIGVGIQDTNVTRFYKKNIVVHKSADLENKLIELITKNVVSNH